MIKHPALRVASSADIDKDFHAALAKECFAWLALTPFADLAIDLQEVGSYACETALLYSDLDFNVAFRSEADLALARKRIQENPDQWRKARDFWVQLCHKYGIHLEFALQDYDVAATNKSYFSLKEMKHYLRDKKVKVRVRQPHKAVKVDDDTTSLGFRAFDPTRDTPASYDPWAAELPKWEQKLGSKLLKFGETPDTAWMKP